MLPRSCTCTPAQLLLQNPILITRTPECKAGTQHGERCCGNGQGAWEDVSDFFFAFCSAVCFLAGLSPHPPFIKQGNELETISACSTDLDTSCEKEEMPGCCLSPLHSSPCTAFKIWLRRKSDELPCCVLGKCLQGVLRNEEDIKRVQCNCAMWFREIALGVREALSRRKWTGWVIRSFS